jgi:tetratricopeptide (TPR) repeat protein
MMTKASLLVSGRASQRDGRFSQARARFEAAIALDPEVAQAWFGKAQAHKSLAQYDDAISAFRRAASIDPDGHAPIAALEVGTCQVMLGRHEEATRTLDELVRAYPGMPEAWHNGGMLSFELQRYDDALARFAREAELQPRRASGWIWRGYCLELLGRHDEATTCYARAGKDSTESEVAEHWMIIGSHEHRRRHLEAALAAYDRAIAAQPGWGVAQGRRGAALADLGRFDEALLAAQRAANLDERLALGSLVNQAAIQSRKGDKVAAETAYRRAVELPARSPEDEGMIGAAWQALGRLDEAASRFSRARTLEPGRVEWAYLEAGCLELAGRVDEAIAAFELLVAENPLYTEAWRRLAECRERKGDHEKAISCCERAAALGPQGKELALVHGSALFQLGRFDEALARFDRALALDAVDERAALGQGWCQLRLGRTEAALATAEGLVSTHLTSENGWRLRMESQRALGRDPAAESSAGMRYAVHLLDEGQIERGLTCIFTALEKDSTNWMARRLAADILMQGRALEMAAEHYQRLLESRPGDAEVWTNLGTIFHGLNRNDEAFDCHRRAVEIAPASAMSLRNYARDLLQRGQHHEALEVCERALALSAESVNAWYMKGVCLARTGDVHGAVACFRRVTSLDAADVDAWRDLGTCLASLGRRREAWQAWEKVAAKDASKLPSGWEEVKAAANEPSADERLAADAYAHWQRGDVRGAVERFDAALALDPRNPEVLVDRGICAEALEGPDRALPFFDAALECAGEHIRAHYSRGVSLGKLNAFGAAARSFRRVIGLHRAAGLRPDSDILEAHLNLAQCLVSLGEKEDALDSYDELIRLARAEPTRWARVIRAAEAGKLLLFGAGTG